MSQARMSMAEIKQAYPDQYVVLVDVEGDPNIPTVTGGIVVSHARSRKEALANAPLVPGQGWALRYTGQDRLPAPGVFLEKYQLRKLYPR